MAVKFDPLLGALRTSDKGVPQYSVDPTSPAKGDLWVLKTGTSGGDSPGKLVSFFGLGVPITESGGVVSYQLSYRTKEGTTIRATMS